MWKLCRPKNFSIFKTFNNWRKFTFHCFALIFIHESLPENWKLCCDYSVLMMQRCFAIVVLIKCKLCCFLKFEMGEFIHLTSSPSPSPGIQLHINVGTDDCKYFRPRRDELGMFSVRLWITFRFHFSRLR